MNMSPLTYCAGDATVARQVVRGVLPCAMCKKWVATIVEPGSTSCNASCNRSVRFYDCVALCTLQFCLQLVSQQNCDLPIPELQKSHGYAGITREEGLQNGQSVRKVSCQYTT